MSQNKYYKRILIILILLYSLNLYHQKRFIIPKVIKRNLQNTFLEIKNIFEKFPNMKANEVCRACLNVQKTFTYFLFENVSSKNYTYCTSIEVCEDEVFPKALCDSCYNLLLQLSEFKRICIQSQEILSNFYKSSDEFLKMTKVESIVPNYSKSKREIIAKHCEGCSTDKLLKITKVEPMSDVQSNPKREETTEHCEGDSFDACDDFPYEENKTKKRITKLKTPKQKKYTTNQRRPFLCCKLCKKKFIMKDRFDAHILEHEGKVVQIQCTPCNKTFKNWSSLQRHKDSDHSRISLHQLKCVTCGKIFKNQQTLQMHQKNHHVNKKILIICDICGKGFSSVTNLKIHMRIHQEKRERQYTCEHCGTKFFTNQHLKLHITKRHDGKRYICELCNYPFIDKNNLIKHINIHYGIKKYKCDICPKSFTVHSTLAEHKRVHSGERPYSCNYCSKSFNCRRTLNDHHRTHTGERPHKCEVCDQAFTQRGTLKRHMKVHKKIVPESCNSA